MEKYSVLMSLYRKEKTENLSSSIQSILAQSVPPDQVIIIKDGSITLELEKVLNEYVSVYPQLFTIIGYEENRGLGYALNYGLKFSRNELVARMDTDDYSLPTRCEKQLRMFESNPDLALLGGSVQFFKESPYKPLDQFRVFPVSNEAIQDCIRKNSAFSHPTVMFRKSAVDACGGYDTGLRRSQDHDLFTKMISEGYECQNIKDVLLLYRMDDNAVLRNRNKESLKARVTIQKRLFERKQCSALDYAYIQSMVLIARVLPVKLYMWTYSILKNDKVT
ncbi:glycosyltransferase [Holdemania massiliensis]|uniref:glycosyltransferase n=1 Tax=Holdemania massiliensis TaxID=1468449 RepID=UPI0035671322